MALTQEHIDQFVNDGYCCVEDVLDSEEIETARNALHYELTKYGVNHDNILNGIDKPLDQCRIKSDVSNIFYAYFKFNMQVNKQMYDIWKALFDAVITEYPLGHHDDVFPFIDRICWRLPDHIKQEGGLGLHLDRRPGPLGLTNIKKYRPIQGFVALTDHYGSESGGLRLCKGFHNQFNEFFKEGSYAQETSGEFFRMHGKSYSKLQKQCRAINVKAGSLVMWDNRLPHATCDKLTGLDTREVIYMSYIPNVPLNMVYKKKQTVNFTNNIQPPSYSDGKSVDKDYDNSLLTDFQKSIMDL